MIPRVFGIYREAMYAPEHWHASIEFLSVLLLHESGSVRRQMMRFAHSMYTPFLTIRLSTPSKNTNALPYKGNRGIVILHFWRGS